MHGNGGWVPLVEWNCISFAAWSDAGQNLVSGMDHLWQRRAVDVLDQCRGFVSSIRCTKVCAQRNNKHKLETTTKTSFDVDVVQKVWPQATLPVGVCRANGELKAPDGAIRVDQSRIKVDKVWYRRNPVLVFCVSSFTPSTSLPWARTDDSISANVPSLKKPSETSLQSNLPVRPWFHLVPLSCSCPRVPPKRYYFVLQLAKHILRINMKMNRVGGRATRNSKHAAQRVYVVIRRPAVGVRKGQMTLLCF